MTTDQIRARMAELRETLERLALVPGDLTGTERSEWFAATTEYEQLEQLQADRTARARAISSAATVEAGDGAAGVGRYRDRNVNRGISQEVLLERAGAAGGVNTRDGGALLADAARAAIDAWSTRSDVPAAWQESAERVVTEGSRYSRQVAEWVAAASTPGYEAAFRAVLAGGPASLHGDDSLELRRVQSFISERAMSEGSGAAGQFAVPPMLDPALLLTSSGSTNPFRQLATVKTIATQTWKGVTTAGVTAEWTAEAAEMTDASPTLGQPTITPVRADALVQASWELFEDSSLASDLAMLFADARDNLEATAFAVGTGSTQPTGVVVALGLITASRVSAQTNGAFGSIDIYNVDDALPARFHPGASWVAHRAFWNRTRRFAEGSGPQHAFWTDFSPGTPSTLLGHAVYDSSAMQSTISAATASSDDCLILADWRRAMVVVDRVPLMVLTNTWVLGPSRRPTAETQVAAFWRVGSDVVVPQAARMLRL
jgi:HK97 family phage major capsid protein